MIKGWARQCHESHALCGFLGVEEERRGTRDKRKQEEQGRLPSLAQAGRRWAKTLRGEGREEPGGSMW
jgi:hypothetical protein